jgi:hypothetical protein
LKKSKSKILKEKGNEIDNIKGQLVISQAENQKICDLNSKLNANIEISKTKGINYKKQIENLKNDLNNVFNNNYNLLKN